MVSTSGNQKGGGYGSRQHVENVRTGSGSNNPLTEVLFSAAGSRISLSDCGSAVPFEWLWVGRPWSAT